MSDMGLSIAASGIAADTALIDTASNNLSNISTPGYAAESVNLAPEAAFGPLGVGQGVVVSSVGQLSDMIYAAANVAAQGVQGAATQTNQVMGSIESIFPEPSSTGLAAQLSTLWSDLTALSSTPDQVGSQQAVVGAAQSVAQTINSSFAQLSQLSTSLQQQVGTGSGDGGTLAQVNSLLAQVAQLNVGVVAGMAGGQDVNALIDTRTAAVNQLATDIGVNTTPGAHGSVTVMLHGVELVAGDVAQTLSSTGSAATGNFSIATGHGVNVNPGGQIGASVAAVNSTIPTYEAQLNSIADSLATKLNGLQATGMAANGDPGSAIAGGWSGTVLPSLFVDGGSSGTYTSSSPGYDPAATIAVSPVLTSTPSLLATASAPGPNNSNVIGQATLDGSNAQAMAALATVSGGPDQLYQTFIGTLGTQAANASSAASVASNLATTAKNTLSSITGVDQNAQEIDVMNAQNAFQASSKVISAITMTFQSLLAAV